METKGDNKVCVERVLEIVASEYGLGVEDLLKPERKYVEPRNMAAYIVRRMMPGVTLSELSGYLHRTHPTLLVGIGSIEAHIKFYPGVRDKYENIKRRLNEIV